MRDIRFRAWDGEQMISPDYIDREGIGHWKENSIPNSSKELMQFTGLLDKNGKEIYEADIVYLAGYGNYQVEFPFIQLYESSSEGDIGEIKGNIYENPELIKEK